MSRSHPPRRYAVVLKGELVEVELRPDPETENRLRALANGEEFPVEMQAHEHEHEGESGVLTLRLGERSVTLWAGGRGRHYDVYWRGRTVPLVVEPLRVHKLRERLRGPGTLKHRDVEEIRAVMPGLVVQVEVQEGQSVNPGDGLVVISAMKMENEIRAPCAGIIERVSVQAGREVRKGELLCVIRRETEAPARRDKS